MKAAPPAVDQARRGHRAGRANPGSRTRPPASMRPVRHGETMAIAPGPAGLRSLPRLPHHAGRRTIGRCGPRLPWPCFGDPVAGASRPVATTLDAAPGRCRSSRGSAHQATPRARRRVPRAWRPEPWPLAGRNSSGTDTCLSQNCVRKVLAAQFLRRRSPYSGPAFPTFRGSLFRRDCRAKTPCAGKASKVSGSPSLAERCRSGRTGRSRKPLWVQAHPGFESLSLRHTTMT